MLNLCFEDFFLGAWNGPPILSGVVDGLKGLLPERSSGPAREAAINGVSRFADCYIDCVVLTIGATR